MSDANLSNLGLRQLSEYDFNRDGRNLITNAAQMRLALQKDKDARLTLDKNGNLKVIYPPQHRDSAFVRFFKRASRAYRDYYDDLKRMDVLSKNISFNQKAHSELLAIVRNEEITAKTTASQALAATYAGMIGTARPGPGGFNSLKQRLNEGAGAIGEALNRAQDFHDKHAFQSYCMSGSDSSACSADEFARSIMRRESTENSTTVTSFKDTAAGLALKCLKDPDSIKQLLQGAEDKIDALSAALLAPQGPAGINPARLAVLLSNVAEAFYRKIGLEVAAALHEGLPEERAAEQIETVLAMTASPDIKAAEVLDLERSGMFDPPDPFNRSARPDDPGERMYVEGIDDIRGYAYEIGDKDLSDEQCLQISEYCYRNKLSPAQFFALVKHSQTVADIGRLLSSGSDADAREALARLHELTAITIPGENTTGTAAAPAPDAPAPGTPVRNAPEPLAATLDKMGSAAGFYRALVHPQAQDEKPDYERLSAALRQINALLSENAERKSDYLISVQRYLSTQPGAADTKGLLKALTTLLSGYAVSRCSMEKGEIPDLLSPLDTREQTPLNMVAAARLWAQASAVPELYKQCSIYKFGAFADTGKICGGIKNLQVQKLIDDCQKTLDSKFISQRRKEAQIQNLFAYRPDASEIRHAAGSRFQEEIENCKTLHATSFSAE